MIIEYTLYNLTPAKKDLLKADLEYLKADIKNQFSEKLIKIRKDRNVASRIVRDLSRKLKILNLTIEGLISNIEYLNNIEILTYQYTDVDRETSHVIIHLTPYIDQLESMKIPLASHFSTSKKFAEAIEKAIKEVYTKEYTFKVTKEGE